MWVEMLNSNQALMETNLQGAVAVAIVTAAKLETQTRLLLDSFGAPASRWCQGRGSCRAGVQPWPQGVGAAGSNSAVPQVLLGFVPSPAQDGKTRSEPVYREGQKQHGGPGTVGQVWGLARAEQSLAEAQGAKCPGHESGLVCLVPNQRGCLGMGSCGDAVVGCRVIP